MTPFMRSLVVPIIGLLLVSSLAGCMRDRGQDSEDPAAGQELLITMTMVEPPEETVGQILDLTVDHVALYDSETDAWVPLFDRAHTVALTLDASLSGPALVAAVPILAGPYTTLELIVSEAVLIDGDNTTTLEVASVACYTPISLTVEPDAIIGLELYLSGTDAFEATQNGWRFQPAITGSLSDHGNGDAHFDDPDCRAIPAS